MRLVILRLLALSIGLAVSLGLAEVALRASGHVPVVVEDPLFSRFDPLHEPDAEIGWHNKPGKVRWPLVGGRVDYTFDEYGARATDTRPGDRPLLAIVMGGSFTQGWGLSDSQTYAWKLAEAFPQLAVVNLGSAGYGTHQSLLALDRFLERTDAHPDFLVYGFIEHHEIRNVATDAWLLAITRTSDAGPVKVPYASLSEEGELEAHAPIGRPSWPLRESLATMAFIESRLAQMGADERDTGKQAVTRELLREFTRIAARHDAEPLVVALGNRKDAAKTMQKYLAFLRQEGIPHVDCRHPRFHERSMKVPRLGHPNEIVNDYWARCIEAELRPAIAALVTPS